MNRRPQRDDDALQFARDQRATANEFAQDVWQMVRNRRCRNQKFRREYAVPTYTIRPKKAAGMISAVTSIWPSKVTKSCEFRVTRSCGMQLRCGIKSSTRSIGASGSVAPHPQPFSPATKASTTRHHREGEGSQNDECTITPNAETMRSSWRRLHRLHAIAESANLRRSGLIWPTEVPNNAAQRAPVSPTG